MRRILIIVATPEVFGGCVGGSWSAGIPKSISLGLSAASSTLDGLRSRCTTPAPCSWANAAASRAPSSSTAGSGSGPTCSSEDPATYSVANHGVGASGSASSTEAAQEAVKPRTVATSRANRSRNRGSAAYSACITFTAVSWPSPRRPRNTSPMPPAPNRPSSRYGPTSAGSSGRKGGTGPCAMATALLIEPLTTPPPRHHGHICRCYRRRRSRRTRPLGRPRSR